MSLLCIISKHYFYLNKNARLKNSFYRKKIQKASKNKYFLFKNEFYDTCKPCHRKESLLIINKFKKRYLFL